MLLALCFEGLRVMGVSYQVDTLGHIRSGSDNLRVRGLTLFRSSCLSPNRGRGESLSRRII